MKEVEVLQEPAPKKCEMKEIIHSKPHRNKEETNKENRDPVKEARVLQGMPPKRNDIKEITHSHGFKKEEIGAMSRENIKGTRTSQGFSSKRSENKEIIHSHPKESHNKENVFKIDHQQSFHRRVESNKVRVQKKKEDLIQNLLGENPKVDVPEKVVVSQERILGDVTNLQIHHISSHGNQSISHSNLQRSRAEQLIKEYDQEKKENEDPNKDKNDKNSLTIKNRISNLRAKLNEQPIASMKKSRSQALTISVEAQVESAKKVADQENKENSFENFVKKNSNNPDYDKKLAKSILIEEQNSINNQENIEKVSEKSENISFKEYLNQYQKLKKSPSKIKEAKEKVVKEKPEIKQTTSSLEESWSTNTSPKEMENPLQNFEKKQENLSKSKLKSQLANIIEPRNQPLLEKSSSPSKHESCIFSQTDKTFLDTLTNKSTTAAQTKSIFTPRNNHPERQSISAGKIFNEKLFNIFSDTNARKTHHLEAYKEENVSRIFDSYSRKVNHEEITMVDWLKEIGLEDLKLNFVDTGYSQYNKFKKDYEKCKTIFEDLLRKFGIDKFGHRCRIIMKLREGNETSSLFILTYFFLDSGLFPRKGAFLFSKMYKNKKLEYPSVKEWVHEMGLDEYLDNFIDNGFDDLEYIILQTAFKELPFDEFLMRDELNIEDEIVWTSIIKKLTQGK